MLSKIHINLTGQFKAVRGINEALVICLAHMALASWLHCHANAFENGQVGDQSVNCVHFCHKLWPGPSFGNYD